MNKYIDADKVISEIQRLYDAHSGKHGCDEVGLNLEYLVDFITTLLSKREQPEADLEKFTEKIKTFQGRYKHPVSTSIKGAMAFMARMFYQYPNIARQWYESLPKATMD